ncbi:hypothetical protein FHT00_001144 [Sphingomonas insulae]|uniref:Uncharacterized protein n=1 Tax=Sphingomonas insulae TaxID=424800 RepID=A0ABN1HRN2_9SPHN|nr:hypothetical protein [Sphingomonas insulae]NIJ29211.1 hypothetical protein [Sphingomonas insulae]
MTSRTHDAAPQVTPSGGVVLLDGPDGIALTFTVDAALELSDRLLDGAIEATGKHVDPRLGPPSDH